MEMVIAASQINLNTGYTIANELERVATKFRR